LKWTVFTDGSFNTRGEGAGVILESTNGLAIELFLRFEFSATNSQVEYEAVIEGLNLTRDLGDREVEVKTNS